MEFYFGQWILVQWVYLIFFIEVEEGAGPFLNFRYFFLANFQINLKTGAVIQNNTEAMNFIGKLNEKN